MTDANEALRALDELYLSVQYESQEALIDTVRNHLTDPGYVRVPVVPSESQWGGLARDIMMWLDFGGRPTGAALYEHLSCLEIDPPQWLRDEVPDNDHVPSKGTRCAIIYRAMIEDHLAAATKETSHD